MAAVLVAAPGVGIAQPQMTAREGNIWGGLNHEPDPAQVGSEERAGLGSPASAQQQNDDVDRLYRSLTGAEGRPPGKP